MTTIIRKSKMHPKYRKVFSENTVKDLRLKARSAGAKRWYCLRKGSLVSAIVVHDSAIVVTNFFREIVNKKRQRLLKAHTGDGSTCPISLSPISDLRPDDVFIHEGVVFSRYAILDYLHATADFRNPTTRTRMHAHDIERLRCKDTLHKYLHRVTLRMMIINSIQQFSFLETELEHILMSLVQQYYFQDTPIFQDSLVAFSQTWREMKFTDRNRTICVLKSLNQVTDKFRTGPRSWGRAFVEKYLKKT